jgi:hypothetical protein
MLGSRNKMMNMDTTMKLTSPLGEVSNNEIVQQMTGNLGW